MIKKAFFHNETGNYDNRNKAGSFFDTAPLKIQWILKESWEQTDSNNKKYQYNDWWKWDNNKTNNPRNAQRFTRLISYCLIEASKGQMILPSNVRTENNNEKGDDTGIFKGSLKQTSVMNIMEDILTNKKTDDSRLKEAWAIYRQDVFETINYSKPEVLIFCIRPRLFINLIWKDLSTYYGIKDFNHIGRIIVAEDPDNGRIIISMHHPSQGFSYKEANEVVKAYWTWKHSCPVL